ncbi:hypothetical protein N7471_010739 [Penicillium samsonianum]|uniref:uncharacterized protein n=1 Tax=Penicillium samsonianum TaxID=1882272 RepID=UPI0025492F97|nr:uncharacterized protein N7471_010739 [Penicillium samsonianum]KAJ6126246.1 hypothetical protein N7471_010739 [Penicillium samsonianum]
MSESGIHITDPQTTLSKNPAEFYIENMSQIHNPDTGIDWLNMIKPSNIRNLRRLWISVHAVYNPGPHPDFLTNNPPNGPRWRELLEKLFTEAECLEEMVLYLDSEPTVNHWGPAVDADFARTLGKFSNLQKLEIRGYFPKEWPGYLEKRTGLRVWQEERQTEQYLSSLREFQELLKDQTL